MGDTFGKVDGIYIVFVGVEYSQGTYHKFFGSDSRQDTDAHLPVESQRLDGWFNGFSQLADIGIFLLFSSGFVCSWLG